MTIQFAGVDLCLEDPEGELAAHVQRFIDWPRSQICTPPRTTDSKSRVQRPNWPEQPRLRPNQLYWPTGATRWAQFIGIASTDQKDEILNTVDPQYATGTLSLYLPDAPTVSITSGNTVDGNYNLQATVAPLMYLLPPVPISADPDTAWIIPLVDIRYWWQSRTMILTATTWTDLFDELATELGITLYRDTTDPIDTEYGIPDPCIFLNGAVNIPAAIDFACWATGHRYTRSSVSGGLHTLRSNAVASTVYALQRNAQLATTAASAAGGDFAQTHYGDVPSNIHWKSTNDSSTLYRSHAQLSGDVPAWAAGEEMSVWSTATYTGSAGNITDLDAMADKWCENWWAWTAWRFDWGFNRCLNWHLTGFEDYALIDFAKRGTEYNANTRVVSLSPSAPAWDFVPTQLTGLSNDCGSGSGGESGGDTCSCCDCTDCLDLCDALEDDVILECSDCPNGTTKFITIAVGYWTEYPNLGGSIQLEWQSACTWESEDLTQDGGTYKWVYSATTKTMTLTHVSGSDPTDITNGYREVVFKYEGTDEAFSCLCHMQLRLQNPDKVKKPAGLKCTVCVTNDQTGTIPSCPEIPRDDPEAIVPCFPEITFPEITFLHSDPNPNHWATDTGMPGGTPMTFPYGYTGLTSATVPMGRVLDVSCPWTGGLRTVPAEEAVGGVGGHDGVTYHVDLNYATGEVTVTFHAYQGEVIADYYLDPTLWVIGTNTLDLATNYSPSDVTWPATMDVIATNCYFSDSHPDVGYGCGGGGSACRGKCYWYTVENPEVPGDWNWVNYSSDYECSGSCGCPEPGTEATEGAYAETDCGEVI